MFSPLSLPDALPLYREAQADGSPCQNVRWRKVDKTERRLVTAEEFDRLGDAALKVSKNGQQFCDYLRL